MGRSSCCTRAFYTRDLHYHVELYNTVGSIQLQGLLCVLEATGALDTTMLCCVVSRLCVTIKQSQSHGTHIQKGL